MLAADARVSGNPMNRDDFRLRAAFRNALKRAGVADRSRLLVAVSGGCDSIVLLHLLVAEAAPRQWEILVAHVDHALRAESGEDSTWVRASTKELGLRCLVARASHSQEGGAPPRFSEEAARRFRRRALTRLADRVDAHWIVLGHTMDDQAETVLLHLLRGTGLRGLAGMRPSRGRWLRPLLAVSRREVRAFAQRHALQWREDSTNLDLRFLRNRVRHQLLPLMQAQFQPAIVRILARMAETVRPVQDRLRKEAAAAWSEVLREGPDTMIRLERLQLAAYPEEIVDEVLRRAYARLRGSARDLKWGHLAPLSRSVRGNSRGRFALPAGIVAVVDRREVRFEHPIRRKGSRWRMSD